MQLEDYAARYLHQPLPIVWEMTWEELRQRFANVVDMVRAERGRPPAGAFDAQQEWL